MDLALGLVQGNRRALARAITAVETGGDAAHAVLGAAYPHAGRAHLIGITGPPGAGKSTLVNSLALHWRRAGLTVGILAVDPTSPFTGGAILGDRIRMQPLGGDPGVFVRSMASRGRLGGVARATGDAAMLLDAAGFDLVVIETVGAGQSEVEIAGAAHSVVVVEVPGMGDDVQSIKAGILEIADVFAVNKADRDGAEQTVRQLRAMLRLGEGARPAWDVPVLPVIATRDEGISALADAILQHGAHLRSSGELAQRLRVRAERALDAAIAEAALNAAKQDAARYDALLARIVAREMDPYQAAREATDHRPQTTDH